MDWMLEGWGFHTNGPDDLWIPWPLKLISAASTEEADHRSQPEMIIAPTFTEQDRKAEFGQQLTFGYHQRDLWEKAKTRLEPHWLLLSLKSC